MSEKLIEQLELALNEGVSKKVLDSYLATALWSSTDESDESGGEPMDSNYSIKDIHRSTVAQAKKDLDKFWKLAGHLLDGEDEGIVAHDFWLTRNGHGAGFWDGDYEDAKGKALTKLSDKFGEVNLYVGDDGKIYG